MLAKRIIACLDVKDGMVVKGRRFENLVYGGNPVELAQRYCESCIDELVFLDIAASLESRKTMIEVIEKVAEKTDIPFTVGGGIRDVDTASKLIYAGADRVSINTAAIENPRLIEQVASKFGSQAVVVAVDAKRTQLGFEVFTLSGKKATKIKLEEWLRLLQDLGAGEVLLTSIDRDGTKEGFDLELISLARKILKIPLIASGGAGTEQHFLEAFKAGADAALGASVFHFGLIDVRSLKKYLSQNKINMRLDCVEVE
ncbi:MAG: Imidazole glycerol phosphate synthase subunit HisF [Thermotoga sp. 50_1627]|uniref:imidazole glycerol phosphate synthase subunit HisF n=1 Tax=Pseudothermotoga sp. TaxID=2033661 RepID=UPI00076CA08F|nr:MAG: Imidazole glycerol phosphate synthase subunit HisF [Thermotoga sp. 50_64]KUK24154.1 MAG: Imidazole glycerol phosphate synthase subunit HisF [Thermotoga sp. 50_1627]MBC7116195.1 imidazole glycerol phosphate synthase subunit HisF [Pseudothermotoga sp.]MDK2923920.1 imidazole glycerol-phosphate synthase subunit HisF [Pseudothermotoga sp.]HBT38781.1 imidazole glycerol phosphate synthase subunit HisF [Pseudothermotoga sp.]